MVKIIESYYEIEPVDGMEMLKSIEKAGRTCYKSEDKITDDSAKKFIAKIMKMGHESVLEHEKITIRLICDRGVTHEIVRHRIASYSQESTRYCNYSKDKHGNEITVIDTGAYLDSWQWGVWEEAMKNAEESYMKLIEGGASPQLARSVLPNSLKTEIVITYNLREWRHFFKLRTSPKAHPQLREITIPLLKDFKKLVPVMFDDIVTDDVN